jgi:hypothetical protein
MFYDEEVEAVASDVEVAADEAVVEEEVPAVESAE